MKTDRIVMFSARYGRAAVLLLAVLGMLVIPCEMVYADKTIDADKTGSVTIRYFDDVDAKTPVYGAEFTFYKIDDSRDTTTYTDTTNQDGILRISDMKLGRYRVVETSPATGHKASASFLLTIPMTEKNEWIYDITLEPKASPDIETTTKSVYTVPGNTSSGLYSSGLYSTGRTGTTSGGTGYAGTSSQMNTSSGKNPAVKSSPVATGDMAHPALWAVMGLAAALFVMKTSNTLMRELSQRLSTAK